MKVDLMQEVLLEIEKTFCDDNYITILNLPAPRT